MPYLKYSPKLLRVGLGESTETTDYQSHACCYIVLGLATSASVTCDDKTNRFSTKISLVLYDMKHQGDISEVS